MTTILIEQEAKMHLSSHTGLLVLAWLCPSLRVSGVRVAPKASVSVGQLAVCLPHNTLIQDPKFSALTVLT